MKEYVITADVIISYLVNDQHYKDARYLFDLVKLNRGKLHITQAVLVQAVKAFEQQYKIPRSEITKALTSILSYKKILNNDKPVLMKALELFAQMQIDFEDCITIAHKEIYQLEIVSFNEGVKQALAEVPS